MRGWIDRACGRMLLDDIVFLSSPRALRRLRRTLVVLVALALAGWVFRSFGDIGFNPTDDGYVIAQSWRILHGAVPHRDVISPRPLGSAYLHALDFAVPLPLMEASRLLATGQIVLYSMLLAALVYDLSPGRWSPAQLVGAVGSVLVNLHSFPLMAWMTVDALTLAAAGFLLLGVGLARRRVDRVYLGLVLIGGATLMKQSFAPVGAVALLWISRDGRRRRVASVGRLLRAAAVLVMPMVVYAGAIACAGGLDAMRTQLGGAAPPKHWFPTLHAHDLPMLAAVAVAFGGLQIIERLETRGAGRLGSLAVTASVALAAFGSLDVFVVALGGHLAYYGTWGIGLFWMLLLAVAIDVVGRRVADERMLAVLGLAWASTLSWGYAVPNLLGGTMALALLRLLWSTRLAARLYRGFLGELAAAAVAVAALTVVVQTFVPARLRRVYFEAPAAELTSAAGDAIPAFGRIRTDERTGTYLRQMLSCLRRFPAGRVAVVPDNPFLYPALGMANPLPIDWLWPAELRGSEERLLEAARRLDREGDYLLLVQTVGGYDVAFRDPPGEPLAPADLGESDATVRAVTGVLRGARTPCEAFVAIHAPRVD